MKIRAITPATVIASLALLFALSGTAVAGALITGANVKNNSIAGIDILNESLGSKDVKNGSLLPKDFKPGALPVGGLGPAGPAGPQGPGGPQGPAGPDGVAGLEIVHATTAADSDGEKTATAACPAGKKVVGGGGLRRRLPQLPGPARDRRELPVQLDQLARGRAGDDRVRAEPGSSGRTRSARTSPRSSGPLGRATGRRVRPAACFVCGHRPSTYARSRDRSRGSRTRPARRAARRAARGGAPSAPRAARHVLAEGVRPADDALPRRLRLLHVRAAAAARGARVHDARTRCSRSRARGLRRAAARRSSRSATSPSCATRSRASELPRSAARRRSSTSRAARGSCSRRPACCRTSIPAC